MGSVHSESDTFMDLIPKLVKEGKIEAYRDEKQNECVLTFDFIFDLSKTGLKKNPGFKGHDGKTLRFEIRLSPDKTSYAQCCERECRLYEKKGDDYVKFDLKIQYNDDYFVDLSRVMTRAIGRFQEPPGLEEEKNKILNDIRSEIDKRKAEENKKKNERFHQYLEKVIADTINMEKPMYIGDDDKLKMRFYHDYDSGKPMSDNLGRVDNRGRLYIEVHYSVEGGFKFYRLFFPPIALLINSKPSAPAYGCVYVHLSSEGCDIVKRALPLMEGKCQSLINEWKDKKQNNEKMKVSVESEIELLKCRIGELSNIVKNQ